MTYEQSVFHSMRTATGRRAYARYVIIQHIKAHRIEIRCVASRDINQLARRLATVWSAAQ